MKIQVRENEGRIIFHILRAFLKMNNCGSKPTSPYFCQQMSQVRCRFDHLDPLTTAMPNRESLCAEDHLDRKGAFVLLESFFQSRGWGTPHPSTEAREHGPGSHPRKIALLTSGWGRKEPGGSNNKVCLSQLNVLCNNTWNTCAYFSTPSLMYLMQHLI